MTIAPARHAAPTTSRRSFLLGAGVGLVTLSAAGAGFIGWEMFNDPLMDPAVAAEGVSTLEQQWSAPAASSAAPTSVPLGTALALLRIPDLGASYQVPIVRGTTPDALHRGVGWFDDTAAPGEIGNFAVAGHRGVTGPFVKLPDLQPGARIEVETRDKIFTYVLDNHPADLVVDKSESWVLDPVPGEPDAKPTTARITLVTCASLIFDQRPRSIGFGHLVDTAKK